MDSRVLELAAVGPLLSLARQCVVPRQRRGAVLGPEVVVHAQGVRLHGSSFQDTARGETRSVEVRGIGLSDHEDADSDGGLREDLHGAAAGNRDGAGLAIEVTEMVKPTRQERTDEAAAEQ